MPLKKAQNTAARSANIGTLVKEGKPVKQAVAIAYSVQQQAAKRATRSKRK